MIDWQEQKQNKQFRRASTQRTHDGMTTPVSFPPRKLYAETKQIQFEKINSIYLREEMKWRVREGGAVGFKAQPKPNTC